MRKNILRAGFGIAGLGMVTACTTLSEKRDPLQNRVPDSSAIATISVLEGEELFTANCITCHTLKYIEMQPDFSRKTWEKITTKMIKNFGAPIPDSSSKKIVNYLVAVKGVRD